MPSQYIAIAVAALAVCGLFWAVFGLHEEGAE